MRIVLLLVFVLVHAVSAFAQDLKVMTFNIRYSTLADSQNAWIYRKEHVAEQVVYHEVELLGVQEALDVQMQDMQGMLTRFKSIGGGRDDGKQKGEYSAIFYDTAKLTLIKSGMFWLAENPSDTGKKGWDAAFPRVVTWAQLRQESTRKLFFAFNTHFDHRGQVARRESAALLIKKVKEISGNNPAVITGDFNAAPLDEPILVLTDVTNPNYLRDSKPLSVGGHYGPTGTFNGFTKAETSDQPIDFIFLKGAWKVLSHATISQTWKGLFASDHFAVLACLRL